MWIRELYMSFTTQMGPPSPSTGPGVSSSISGTTWLGEIPPNGSITFAKNLRRHGDQVKAGNLGEALISTYFSMAHEVGRSSLASHAQG